MAASEVTAMAPARRRASWPARPRPSGGAHITTAPPRPQRAPPRAGVGHPR